MSENVSSNLFDRIKYMLLQFIQKTASKIAVEVYDNDSSLLQQRLINRYQERDIRWLATVAQWEVAETNQAVAKFIEGSEDAAAFDFEPPEELVEAWKNLGKPVEETDVVTAPFLIHVRELTQPKQYAKSIKDVDPGTALERAFADSTQWKEPLIEWADIEQLCCLDIDYHFVTPPTPERILEVVSKLKPQPFAWHYSHGGGAKLYYLSHPGYNALELASVAGMQWVDIDPRATFDLIRSTRHPCFWRSRDKKPAPCSAPDQVYYPRGSGDVSGIKRLLTDDVDPEDVEILLQSKGWNIGQTLQHNLCPIEATSSHKECVFIGDKGVFCHICAAKGYGGKQAGFLSYSTMIHGADNRIRSMVKNFVHLEQARIVLENKYPNIPANVLADIYRVMLKVVHNPDDPRIVQAMLSGKGFVRIKGQWVTADGNTSVTEGVNQFVRSLPAVMYVGKGDDGPEMKPDTSKWLSMINGGDLSHLGYHDISFIRGCKIYGQFLPYPHNENVKVICRPEFDKCRPQYLPPGRRMKEEDAWKLLESEFPGINRTYVKLLIAAKGASEGRLAQCPFLMITGVSSAGKSTTVHIAAGICGDKADEPIFYPDVQRFRGSLMDAAKTSGFVCVNEVFKMSDRAKLGPTQALDPMLSLTEDSRSHVLYVGSVPFGRLPVFVLTDINCPPEIMQDYQLARRFTFFRLDSSIEWSSTLVERGIRPHEFRLISPEHAAASDTILSCVIDEFFQEPTPLAVIVNRLGIGTTKTEESNADSTPEMDERSELKATLRSFYNAVISAPALTGTDAQRYNPKSGWKKIDRMATGGILDIWGSLCDAPSGPLWCRSRVCDAEDWGKLLKLDFPVVLDIKQYQGRILYVRFRSTESSKLPKWLNGKRI